MVYVGLGSNVGDGAKAVKAAAEALARAFPGARVRLSSLWRTAPVGPVRDQAWFVNAVAELSFGGAAIPTPREILDGLLAIERSFGRDRDRETAGGPRTLDLDLLLVDDRVVDEPGLIVPHPRMTARAFVLEPLAELAGEDLMIPGAAAIGDLLHAVRSDRSQTVTRIV
jgi:2-amino-4-hydroxy-6-hydroxymethyldihydropteridine diphosphokinase